MKNDKDSFRFFRESLKEMGGNLHVLEINVSVEKQIEYFHYVEEVKRNSHNQTIDKQIAILNSSDASPEETKFAMTYLAISGDVEAYRTLENYAKSCKDKPDDWAALSLLQAKITLESELTDERQVFISTGLGGIGSRLRFFSFFKSTDLKPFSDYQRKLIDEEFPYYIQKHGGILEAQTIGRNYISVIFLIDFSIDIKNMLLDAVIECNQYGDFIDAGFIVTNVKIFNERDIARELDGSGWDNRNLPF